MQQPPGRHGRSPMITRELRILQVSEAEVNIRYEVNLMSLNFYACRTSGNNLRPFVHVNLNLRLLFCNAYYIAPNDLSAYVGICNLL